MKLYIKWRYPDEAIEHEKIYHGIDPETITIRLGMLFFGEKDRPEQIWSYKLDHIVEMMKFDVPQVYEIGYQCADGIYSVNMVEGTESEVVKYATNRAQKFGYNVAYISPLNESQIKENKAKGMPFKKL